MNYLGVGVSPGNVPVYHGSNLRVLDIRVRVAELILRSLICGFAVVSALLIGTGTQVKEIFTIEKRAKFTDMKALVLLVIANGIAASYSFFQVVRCVISMVRGSVLFNKPLAWAIFSGDQGAGKLRAAPKMAQTEPVKISLKDCLACSGCITSAETVMLERQSLDEFLVNLNNGKAVIVSLSPQSRASLAVHFGLSPLQVFQKLTTLLKSLGVKAIFDTSTSRDLTLIESCNEFMSRYRESNSTSDEKSKSALPMVSSACPGWICYAEKTLGSYILPHISSVKSPQQTIGAAIKNHTCHELCIRPEEMYHVTVMPCYDKKLEAARDDFVFQADSDAENITEVDSVLTTGEVLDLIKMKSVDFTALEESPVDKLLSNIDEEGNLYGVNGSSGGYADTVFRYAAKMLFGKEIKGPLEYKTIRNADFREVTLEVDGKVVLRFALCYGFRNLRNIVTKIKSGKCEYHFLEIMACPSGCLNGGGQIKPNPGQSAKDLIQQLEATYSENVLVADPFENPRIKKLYDEWLEQPGSEKARGHLHTEYHTIVKSISSQLQNW